jgi:hypothetical protein
VFNFFNPLGLLDPLFLDDGEALLELHFGIGNCNVFPTQWLLVDTPAANVAKEVLHLGLPRQQVVNGWLALLGVEAMWGGRYVL